MFCEKGVLRNFAKFTGKHLCQSLFFDKVAGGKSTFFYRTPPVAASELDLDKEKATFYKTEYHEKYNIPQITETITVDKFFHVKLFRHLFHCQSGFVREVIAV